MVCVLKGPSQGKTGSRDDNGFPDYKIGFLIFYSRGPDLFTHGKVTEDTAKQCSRDAPGRVRLYWGLTVVQRAQCIALDSKQHDAAVHTEEIRLSFIT